LKILITLQKWEISSIENVGHGIEFNVEIFIITDIPLNCNVHLLVIENIESKLLLMPYQTLTLQV